MKIYTKLFLNEIYDRISYLVYLYENRTSSVNYDESKISEFNVNLLVRKGYIEVHEDSQNKKVILTEEGINFIVNHIEDFKKVS